MHCDFGLGPHFVLLGIMFPLYPAPFFTSIKSSSDARASLLLQASLLYVSDSPMLVLLSLTNIFPVNAVYTEKIVNLQRKKYDDDETRIVKPIERCRME